MKNYLIQKVENIADYPFVVYSTSYVSPIDAITDIELELQSHFRGKILFDLLLSNGVSSNRFMEAVFDGEHFDYSSFKSLIQVDAEIKGKLIEFYQKNTELLENSILPNAYQYLIKKGKVL